MRPLRAESVTVLPSWSDKVKSGAGEPTGKGAENNHENTTEEFSGFGGELFFALESCGPDAGAVFEYVAGELLILELELEAQNIPAIR